ncbi:PepSY domain-containing protein [Alkalihalobacterium chitinilyticum]|uniref:PepSY domain-containing protein n=1 Tax=Alkalihalobacterium chitinilyticum TaxID=2980103 RepID=A0ABT5VK82_9BACI|nr:PepSY domain-containing protein [Alkalihalobacterium chitinilyticum]MDE5415863.1 PepSY domain-containing protein [Alkalihalobacterium chitinilyticum]
MKRFALGIGVGLVAGLLLRSKIGQDLIAPERALKQVKNKLSHSFNVTGSWIHMIPETWNKNQLEYTVYRGGLTASTENDENLQYDFIVDAKTGTILDVNQ